MTVRGFADALRFRNSQDVPLDSAFDRSKDIRRQFAAAVILIDQRKYLPGGVGFRVAENRQLQYEDVQVAFATHEGIESLLQVVAHTECGFMRTLSA